MCIRDRRYGGRLYLSKDARMSKEFFEESYKSSSTQWSKILKLRPKKFESYLSKRLMQ